MEKKLKSWQGWLLFGGTMVVVFVLGMIAASVNERHAEVTSVMNNKKTEITGIEARNDKFESNYPREYQTWEATADTSFKSLYNGNQAVDVLEKWLSFGLVTLSLRIILPREGICMRSRICVTRCV